MAWLHPEYFSFHHLSFQQKLKKKKIHWTSGIKNTKNLLFLFFQIKLITTSLQSHWELLNECVGVFTKSRFSFHQQEAVGDFTSIKKSFFFFLSLTNLRFQAMNFVTLGCIVRYITITFSSGELSDASFTEEITWVERVRKQESVVPTYSNNISLFSKRYRCTPSEWSAGLTLSGPLQPSCVSDSKFCTKKTHIFF